MAQLGAEASASMTLTAPSSGTTSPRSAARRPIRKPRPATCSNSSARPATTPSNATRSTAASSATGRSGAWIRRCRRCDHAAYVTELPFLASPFLIGRANVNQGGMSDELANANAHLISGWQFMATLQLRTPLAVLKWHGQKHSGPPSQLPAVCDPAHGCWVVQTRSWSELTGLNLPDQGEPAVASMLGPIKPSEYVPFLIAFRQIVESNVPVSEKLIQLEKLPTQSKLFNRLWARHQEYISDFPQSFFWQILSELPGIGHKTGKALYDAGYYTVSSIASATESELIKIEGVGPTTARKAIAAAKATC